MRDFPSLRGYLAWRIPFALLGTAALAVVVAQACTPEIGDKCIVSTDCSVQGDRLCDTSQPGGYCTQLNCHGNDCADDGSCVLFNSAVPGCSYDDRAGGYGSRIARSFCEAVCTTDGDCRPDYVCADPRTAPWNAIILDNNQGKRGCLPKPLEVDAGATFSSESPICQATTFVAGDAAAPIEAGAAQIVEAGAAPPLFPSDASITLDAGSRPDGAAGDGG